MTTWSPGEKVAGFISVKTGNGDSTTINCSQETWFPEESVAVHITVVGPIGKTTPFKVSELVKVFVKVTALQLSVAVVSKLYRQDQAISRHPASDQ